MKLHLSKSLFAALLATAGLAAGSNAYAAACTLSGSAVLGGASTDDATLSMNGGPANESDACHVSTLGSGGNTSGTLLADAFGGADFTRIAKLGESPDPAFLGINFTLTATGATSGSTSGTWTLAWTGGPANLDLVFAIHASNRTGSFLFDDVPLVADASGTGTWKIEWLNNGGQVPGFSNLTVWARQGDGPLPCTGPDCDPEPCTGPDCDPVQVPEPGTLSILGLGALALAARVRRRKA